MYRYNLLLCALSFLSALLPIDNVFACSCVPGTLEGSFLKAEGVYLVQIRGNSGEVTFSEGINSGRQLKHSYGVVIRNYKGPYVSDLGIYSFPDTSHSKCFRSVETWKTYVIFANSIARPTVTICSRSRILDNFTKEQLEKLNKLSMDYRKGEP